MSDLHDKSSEQYKLQPELAINNPSVASAGVAPDGTPITSDQPADLGPSILREMLETIVLAVVLFLVIRMVVQNYRIESHSMEPNFYEGQFVLVNKLAYRLGEPNRGEVMVFHNPNNPGAGDWQRFLCWAGTAVGRTCSVSPGEDYIKRVIGLPGDTVEVVGDIILINGEELPQPYVHNLNPENAYFGPLVVPDGTVFVMGDNRPRSSDSRAIGPISEELMVGKAWLRVWPLSEFGFIQHYDLNPGQIIAAEN